MQELDFYRRLCAVTASADLEATLGRALEALLELSGAEGGLLVVAGEDGALRTPVQRGAAVEQAISRGILGRVFAGGASVRLENALEDPEYQGLESVRRLNILSVLAVPIVHDGEAIAAVYLFSTRVTGVFDAATEETVERFAAGVAPAVAASLEAWSLRQDRDALAARLESLEGFDGVLGAHPRFLAVLADTEAIAAVDVPVLIQGESGTGKELIARAIHAKSPRRDRPLVALNCGAIPESLLESEFFGHVKGAFTGATARAGKFRAAHTGTIFLDEVGELSPAAQVRLLRVLQSGELQPVGSDAVERVDVRVVAATHRPLQDLVAEGGFRDDLYYRLSGLTLEVPPLRERGEDVLLLAEHFLRRTAARFGRDVPTLTPAARAALLAHDWPGNVRELLNAIHRAVVFARDGAIGPERLVTGKPAAPAALPLADRVPATRAELTDAKQEAAARLERAFVVELLTRTQGVVAEASRLGEIHRSSLHELIKRHDIDPLDFK